MTLAEIHNGIAVSREDAKKRLKNAEQQGQKDKAQYFRGKLHTLTTLGNAVENLLSEIEAL